MKSKYEEMAHPVRKTFSPLARLAKAGARTLAKTQVAFTVAGAGIAAAADVVAAVGDQMEATHRLLHGPRFAAGDIVRVRGAREHTGRALIIRELEGGRYLLGDGVKHWDAPESDILHVIHHAGTV